MTTTEPQHRPPLTAALSAAEFERWYWLTAELQSFARALGIRSTGGKRTLTARIRASLSGEAFAEPETERRRTGGSQLAGELHEHTVIPAGQRCSQHVRAWFTQRVGPGFRFDGPMRAFFAATPGDQTLGDALEHWYSTRDNGTADIAQQFEYNRFTRAWRAAHPDGDRAALLADWWAYRD